MSITECFYEIYTNEVFTPHPWMYASFLRFYWLFRCHACKTYGGCRVIKNDEPCVFGARARSQGPAVPDSVIGAEVGSVRSTQLESVDRLENDAAYREACTNNMQRVALNVAANTEGAMAVYVRFNPEFTPHTSGLFWSKTAHDRNFISKHLLIYPDSVLKIQNVLGGTTFL